MAQQYQSPAPYGGQYAQMPYYPHYNAQSQQQSQSPGFNQHGQPQNIHPHAAGSNARRFEANSQIPTPPIPFQLPSNFNPDILKQLAGSNLPIPPPPPPFAIPFSSTSFPAVPYPAFHAHNGAGTPPTEYHPGAQEHVQPHNSHPHYAAPPNQHFQPAQAAAPSATFQPVQSQPPHFPNAESAYHAETGTATRHLPTSTRQQFAHDLSSGAEHNSPVSGPSSDALQASIQPLVSTESRRYDARQAILELFQAGISLENVVREGVNPDLVRKLFEELGLQAAPVVNSSTPANVGTPTKISESTSVEKPRKPEPETTVAQAKSQPLATNAASGSEVASAGLERKDRIAKLLAAKRGQISSNPSSASASPAPPESKALPVSAPSQVTATEIQPPVVPSNLGLSFESDNVARDLLQAVQSPSAPITNRHELSDSAMFSIPGLFMNSADDIGEDQPQEDDTIAPSSALGQPDLASNNADVHMVAKAQTTLKRKPEADVDMSPWPKRQLSEDATVRPGGNDHGVVKDLQTDTISAAPISTPPPTVLEGPAQQQKAAEIPETGSRPKVNQEKLSARMAALRADLLRRNSRQKALQDGMPALDAEVQSLRDRLSKQEQDLDGIRQQIESREKELTHFRDEEKVILQQISDLRLQVAAGETGQQQVSSELNQINNQQQNATDDLRNAIAKSADLTAEDIHRSAAATPQTSGGHENALSADGKANPDEGLQPAQPESQVPEETWNGAHGDSENQAASTHSMNDIAPTPDVVSDSDKQMSMQQDSDASSDGSASMSDSGSEDYEPAGVIEYDNGAEDVAMEDEGEYDPEELEGAQPEMNSGVAENDDHVEYEPTEAIDANDVVQDMDMSDGEIHTTPAEVSITADVDDVEASAQKSALEAEQIRPNMTVLTNHSTERPVDSTLFNPLGGEPDSVRKHYVPYNSPLTSLKSFRFHPQYSEIVKDGYRSLTYSNQIDPKAPLCPTELSGETCTDPTCSEQHFGSMALSDDKILVQMSSANDIKDKSQRDAYLIGLKKVIADLRERGVKEFSEVANELSKYRRDWTLAQTEAES